MLLKTQLLLECLSVGVNVTLLTLLTEKIFYIFNITIHSYYLLILFTSAMVHYLSEMAGLNTKYCIGGVACRKLREKKD